MKLTYLCLASLLPAVTACKRESDEIKVYKVSKEQPAATAPPTGAGAAMPGSAMPGATAGDPHAGVPGMGGGAPAVQVTDAPPAHWEKRPGAGMRLVGYFIKGEGEAAVAVSLSSLRAAPTSLSNGVNMWREQLGQPVADEAAIKQLPTATTTFGDGVLVDIEGVAAADKAAPPGRLIGVIAEGGGNAWYFKMVGDAALVAKERGNFIQWVAGAKAVPAAAAPPENTAQPAAPAAPAGDGSLTWTVPEGWTLAPKAGMGGMGGYASFVVKAPDGTEAKMAVSHFPGDVGGNLANVNRWRGQVGAAPVQQEELATLVTKITAGDKTLQVIDCTGPQARCAAAWVRHGAETWFFKFTGPDALIGAEKARFTAFLATVRFTRPE